MYYFYVLENNQFSLKTDAKIEFCKINRCPIPCKCVPFDEFPCLIWWKFTKWDIFYLLGN